jgi:hypothetical protein
LGESIAENGAARLGFGERIVRGGSDFNREDLYKVGRWNCRGEDEGLNERRARWVIWAKSPKRSRWVSVSDTTAEKVVICDWER